MTLIPSFAIGLFIVLTVTFLLLSVVFLVLYLLKSKKYRKEIKEIAEETGTQSYDVERLKEELSIFESKIMDKDTFIKKLTKEKEGLELKVKEFEVSSVTYRDESQMKIRDLEAQVSNMQLKLDQLEGEVPRLQKEVSEKDDRLRNDNSTQIQRISELEKQAETYKAENHALKDVIDNLEETVREKDHRIEHLQSEIADLHQDLRADKEQIEEFRAKSTHDNDYYRKLGDIDLNMIKLEKIERLKNKKIITQEEFVELRKKYLDSL